MTRVRRTQALAIAAVIAVISSIVVLRGTYGETQQTPSASLQATPDWVTRLPAAKQTIVAISSAQDATASASIPRPQYPDRDYDAIAKSRPPRPTPASAGKDVRPCSAGDLDLLWGGQSGASGMSLRFFVLASKSDTPCRLDGVPTIALLAGGEPITGLTELSNGESELLPVPSQPLLLTRSTGTTGDLNREPVPGEATLSMGYLVREPSGELCSPAQLEATSIRLALPQGGGDLTLDLPRDSQSTLRPCHRFTVGLAGVSPPAPPQPPCPEKWQTGLYAADATRLPAGLVNYAMIVRDNGIVDLVYAGALADDSKQGLLLVTQDVLDICSLWNKTGPQPDSTLRTFLAPSSGAALTLTRIDVDSVDFVAADGTKGVYSFQAGKIVGVK